MIEGAVAEFRRPGLLRCDCALFYDAPVSMLPAQLVWLSPIGERRKRPDDLRRQVEGMGPFPVAMDHEKKVRPFLFMVLPGCSVKTEHSFDLFVAKGIEPLDLPSLKVCGKAEAGDCVAHIVVAVPECPFSVFPGLPPVDAAQFDEWRFACP
jgi:hypothetical protein